MNNGWSNKAYYFLSSWDLLKSRYSCIFGIGDYKSDVSFLKFKIIDRKKEKNSDNSGLDNKNKNVKKQKGSTKLVNLPLKKNKGKATSPKKNKDERLAGLLREIKNDKLDPEVELKKTRKKENWL